MRIVDISRMPAKLISNVRGIGVALIVSTSTWVRIDLMCSLCSTPKRCSSSTTMSPRSFHVTPVCSSRWVPITMSTLPSFIPSSVARDSAGSVKRDRPLTVTGNPAVRAANVCRC